MPANLARHAGTFVVGDATPVVLRSGDPASAFVARHLVDTLAATSALRLHVSSGGNVPTRGAVVFHLDPGAGTDKPGSYVLDVSPHGITVTARTAKGLYYGSVTLWQLLTPGGTRTASVEVPAVHIDDWPRFRWRGLMLDSARHFQSVADIEKLINWMSLHKLDVLHWHLSDDQGWRLEIPQYPELTKIGACRKAVGPDVALTGSPDKPYCGGYTDAEVRQIVRYAAERYITVVPEIDVPGHSQAAIAAYPWLGVTGKRPPVATERGIHTWLLRPDARTLQFLDAVFDEVMKLFPSKYIHIGGDEAAKDQWNASPEVQAHMRALGLGNMDQMQGWFTTQVANHLIRHGRTPVGWDDELLAGGKLPADEVMMSWHDPDVALRGVEEGHDVVMATSPTLYLDHYQSSLPDEPPGRPAVESLEDVYDYDPVPKGATAAQAAHILGLQANLWTEYMTTFARVQHAVFPRLAALSEVAWSPASVRDWHGFLERMPAELARYRSLGIEYADSAFAPAFALQAGADDTIDVTLSNQANFGAIRYTTDGAAPTADSALYAKPLSFPSDATTTLRAATFAADDFELAAPRTRTIDAAALLTRDSDQLGTCKDQLVLRLQGNRPLHDGGHVYKIDIENMCWEWKGAPLDGVHAIALTVGHLPWNFALWTDNAKVVARPKATPAGEFQIHLDSCDGPLLATLPLAKAAQAKLQTTLTASIPATTGHHTLCMFATGDPRDGLWAIGRIELLRSL
ncbi:MAG: family 20 glycosylhydrolase [Rhodanobacteraceae bacterium]